jgi:hypothetical protein
LNLIRTDVARAFANRENTKMIIDVKMSEPTVHVEVSSAIRRFVDRLGVSSTF